MEADANAAVMGRTDLAGALSVRQQTVRELHLVVETDFTARAGGEEIMAAIVSQAQARDAAEPSYVRLKSVDDQALTVEERRAAAPDWTVTTATAAI